MSEGNRPGSIDELTALYRQTIVEHAVHPIGFDVEIDTTHSREIYNPLCGDRIEVQLKVEDDAIEALAFTGEACAICLASASLMCERQAGKTVDDLRAAHRWLESALKGNDGRRDIDGLMPLLGVRAYPSRVRCALLPWEAATEALTMP